MEKKSSLWCSSCKRPVPHLSFFYKVINVQSSLACTHIRNQSQSISADFPVLENARLQVCTTICHNWTLTLETRNVLHLGNVLHLLTENQQFNKTSPSEVLSCYYRNHNCLLKICTLDSLALILCTPFYTITPRQSLHLFKKKKKATNVILIMVLILVTYEDECININLSCVL